MRRAFAILHLAALFLCADASAQFAGGYHAWQRPFLAYDQEAEVWIAAYVSPEGQAYEHRDKTGALLAVYVRYQGECYTSRDGLEWRAQSCHLFISLDAKFRQAVIAHQRRQSAGKA